MCGIFKQVLILSSGDVLISAAQCGKLTNESKEILGGAGEMAQARCVKLINVRAKVRHILMIQNVLKLITKHHLNPI
jgi:hypothetical protein